MEPMEPPRETGARRRGNALGFYFFETSVRCFGLRGAYGLLYFVCLYYLLFDRSAVRASLAYIRRRFPRRSQLRQLLDVYLLFISQGRNLIDRYCLVSGIARFDTRLEGEQMLTELVNDPRGFVLLTAHVGGWQAIMSFLPRFRRKVNLVMRPEDNPAIQESLRISVSGQEIGIISPDAFLGGVVEVMNALERGEVVSLMGDRSYGLSPVEVEFLHDRAWFGSGALHIAAMTGCQVGVLLSAKTGTHSYEVSMPTVFRPRYEPGVPKKEQLRGWVQEFARVLEVYLERNPYQCFLFYDIWRKPEESQARVVRDRQVLPA